mgnify:CR=1 FL=1
MAVIKGLILSRETEPDSGVFAEYWKITDISISYNWNNNVSSPSINCVMSGWLNKNKYTNNKKILSTLFYNFNNIQYRLNNANPDQQFYDLITVLPDWTGAVQDI